MRTPWVARCSVVLVAVSTLMACGAERLPPASRGSSTGTIHSLDDITDTFGAVTAPDSSIGQPDITVDSSQMAPPVVAPQQPIGVQTSDAWVDITSNLVGVPSECGNLSFVAGHPSTDLVLAGIALQGLWQLNEAGDGWVRTGADPQSDPIGNRTTSVLFDPDDLDRFWQSGSYSSGAFRTDDGGQIYSQLGDIDHLDYICVDLNDPLRLTALAGGHERTEIYKTIDGGQSWASLADNLPIDAGITSYPLVVDATTHLMGSNSGEGSGVFRTIDGGITWSRVSEIAVTSPPVRRGDTIYWLAAGGAGLLVSRDLGQTFELAGQRTGGASLSLVDMPDGRLATHNAASVLVTADEGQTWTEVGPRMPFDPWGLAYSAERDSFYIWVFTCDFSVPDQPVVPMSILQIDAIFTE